jgi:dihydrofolate reductase
MFKTRAPIYLIAAVSTPSGVLGRDNKLIWHLPEDMKRFRLMTMGSVVVMGRKTWDSIPQAHRPLVGRTNVVLSHRELDPQDRDKARVTSCEPDQIIPMLLALSLQSPVPIWICGGAMLYEKALQIADALCLTFVVESELPPNLLTQDERGSSTLKLDGSEVMFPHGALNEQDWDITRNLMVDTQRCKFCHYKRKRPLVMTQDGLDRWRFVFEQTP